MANGKSARLGVIDDVPFAYFCIREGRYEPVGQKNFPHDPPSGAAVGLRIAPAA